MEIFRFLEDHGVDTSDIDGLLRSAIYEDWASLARLMFERGAELERSDHWGRTPLLVAVEDGAMRVLEALLEMGADPFVHDEQDRSALHLAAEESHAEVLRLLLRLGLDVNHAEKYGETPLHVVDRSADRKPWRPAMHCRLTNRLLLKHGADIEARDGQNVTPLGSAADRSRPVFLDDLIRTGAKLNVPGVCGRTPLMLAIVFRKRDNVSRLIQAGADIHIEDEFGETALDYAADIPEIANLFMR